MLRLVRRTTYLLAMISAVCFALFVCVGCDELFVDPVVPSEGQSAYGCGKSMLDVPADPLELGPWPVASRYVEITNPQCDRSNRDFCKQPTRIQIYYPAKPGSERGYSKKVLDVPDLEFYLPGISQKTQGKNTPTFPTTYYEENLPIDTDHGPYPVIVYVHGTTSSTISHYKMTSHWASRGFVVVIADYNGINMRDMLVDFTTFYQKQQFTDTKYILQQIRALAGPFSFLKGSVDLDRIGLAGHSWGGYVIGRLGAEAGVKVVIPMASTSVYPSESNNVENVLVLGAQEDFVIGWDTLTIPAYEATEEKKRLVGIPRAGHMAFADVCDIVLLHEEFGIPLDDLILHMATDGCNEEGENTFIDQDDAMNIIKYSSAGVFEETLQCSDTAGAMVDNIKNKFSSVAPDLVYQAKPNGGATRPMPNWDAETSRLIGRAVSGMMTGFGR